jgi:hypothetical protein
MGLRATLQAVAEQLNETLAELGDRLPSYGYSAAVAHRSSTPPRIVFVPVGGNVRRPSTTTGGDGTYNPRALWMRDVALQVEVWGEDADAAEELAGHLVAAMHRVLHASYEVVSEAWDTRGETAKGQAVTLGVVVKVPFTDEPAKTVVVGSAPVTGDIVEQV